jgi:prepilin-type N-terminal cleavage/methylation domain-containing protein
MPTSQLPPARHAAGFTLIEVVITLAIVAIMLTLLIARVSAWRDQADMRAFRRSLDIMPSRLQLESAVLNRVETIGDCAELEYAFRRAGVPLPDTYTCDRLPAPLVFDNGRCTEGGTLVMENIRRGQRTGYSLTAQCRLAETRRPVG